MLQRATASIAIPLRRWVRHGYGMWPRQRHGANMRTAEPMHDTSDTSTDIDFTQAGLYLVGLQVVVAIVACCITSVACCWLLPLAAISAVRTVALTSFVGLAAVHKPLRLGRVRGVTTVFNGLRPGVALYVGALVVEQLVHTCVSELQDVKTGRWRSGVFHLVTVCMLGSGMLRALRPRSETDLPFLVTLGCLLLSALLPPPPHALSGPLCEPASLMGAAERLLRALLFALLYVTHVYACTPTRNALNELSVCIIRAAAASAWVLAGHSLLLTVAPLQAALALWSRFGTEDHGYQTVGAPPTVDDAEMGLLAALPPDPDPVAQSARLLAQDPFAALTPAPRNGEDDTPGRTSHDDDTLNAAALAVLSTRATQAHAAKTLSRQTGSLFQLQPMDDKVSPERMAAIAQNI